MRSGRPPKPTEVHRRAGTLRPDRHAPVPVVAGGRTAPKPPAGVDPQVRRAFVAIVRVLEEANILDTADAGAVEAAAVALVRAREAGAHIRKHGLFIEVRRVGRDGSELERVEPNPAVRVERDAWTTWLRFAEQLGLTPSARARLANAAVGAGKAPAAALPGMGELRAIRGGQA